MKSRRFIADAAPMLQPERRQFPAQVQAFRVRVGSKVEVEPCPWPRRLRTTSGHRLARLHVRRVDYRNLAAYLHTSTNAPPPFTPTPVPPVRSIRHPRATGRQPVWLHMI